MDKVSLADSTPTMLNGKPAQGLRYNEGKLRYDLINPFALEQLARVFSKGAEKYAIRNWEKGMAWSTVIASLKRHTAAIEKGEDYDPETGLLHSSHVEWNAHALTAYYKLCPELDDRPHSYLINKRIGLDIDGVLGDFIGQILKYSKNEAHTVTHWNDPIVRKWYEIVKNDNTFWENIPPLLSSCDIPFEPRAYITSRSIPIEITQYWLDKHFFPTASLYSVGHGESKVSAAKEAGIDIYVDDNYDNFVELNNAGILTYLYTAPYNTKYNVGHLRIKSLKELI